MEQISNELNWLKLYSERFNDVALEYELWGMEVEREHREMQKEMKQQGYNLN